MSRSRHAAASSCRRRCGRARRHDRRRARHGHAVQHPRAAVAGLDVGELQHRSPPRSRRTAASLGTTDMAAVVAAPRCRGRPPAPSGRPAPRPPCPRESTLPWCSTVTRVAKRRMKSMSCSTTSTVRFAAIALQQLAGRGALVLAHPGDRLVEQQQPRVLHEQHRDLQPLLLAVRQDAGRRRAARRSSPIVSSAARSTGSTPRRARSSEAASGGARRRCRGSAAR